MNPLAVVKDGCSLAILVMLTVWLYNSRSMARWLRFFTLTQCFWRPPR
jgi:hypothetical protein